MTATGQSVLERIHGPGTGIPRLAQGMFCPSKDVVRVLDAGMSFAQTLGERLVGQGSLICPRSLKDPESRLRLAIHILQDITGRFSPGEALG